MKGIIGLAFGGLIAAIVLTTATWPIDQVETYYTAQPYTYNESEVLEKQVRNFPWINEVTQAQYIVQNTDLNEGKFVINFIFNNGNETATRTKTVGILGGEQQALTMNSPLKGISTIVLNVIPPNYMIPHQRTVQKMVNGWDYVGRYVFSP